MGYGRVPGGAVFVGKQGSHSGNCGLGAIKL